MMNRNIGYKLLALAIAIVIWAYANKNQNPNITRELALPLDVQKLETGYVVTSKPKTVKVLLEGPRTQINSIVAEPDAVTAHVNLIGKTAGIYTLPVIVRLPSGFAGLVGTLATPRKVSIKLEEKTDRTLSIGVQFVGSPPVGYRFGTPQIQPDKAVIKGIARDVASVSRLVVATDPGDSGAQSINGDFQIIAQDKYGSEVRSLELEPAKVHLHLDLLEAPANRVIFVSVNTVGRPPFPYKVESIEVQPDTVTVAGLPEQLANVSTLETEPIQLANRTKTFTQRVRISIPTGLTIAGGSDVRVTLKISSSEAGGDN